MLLKLEDLCKAYRRGEQSFLAVDHVNLALSAGELAVVTGPSGCGKSTLFNLIAALISPDSGKITLFDRELSTLSADERARLRRSDLAYILQGKALLPQLTVLENICLPATLGHQGATTAKAQELLIKLGMEQLAAIRPAYLSGGEQRRVAVARALSYGAKLILADEPCSNLDQANAEAVVAALRLATEAGAAVLLSSHDQDWAKQADSCYQMAAGRLTRL